MISFVIPAKNEEHYIADCLRSIMAQSDCEPFEIIVVDNNSTDRTLSVVKQVCPSAIIATETRAGASAARHRGFLEAKGEWLVFLDADVRLPDPLWLRRVLNKIAVTPRLVALSTHYHYFDLLWHQKCLQIFGQFVFLYPWLFIVNTLLRRNATLVGGIMVIKKTALIQIGGFNPERDFFVDEVIIASRLCRLGRIIVSPRFWVRTSGRRFRHQHIVKVALKHALDYFWVLFIGKPYNVRKYTEFR